MIYNVCVGLGCGEERKEVFYHWKQAFSASNLNREETYGHKKRSNALLQPLLTLNLIL